MDEKTTEKTTERQAAGHCKECGGPLWGGDKAQIEWWRRLHENIQRMATDEDYRNVVAKRLF